MQKTLCSRCAKKGIPRWLPTAVEEYRLLLLNYQQKQTKKTEGFYVLASNVGYELQYLEYIEYTLANYKTTSSITAQQIKTFVITASNIVEGILYYCLAPTMQEKHITFNMLIKEAQRIDLLNVEPKVYKLMWEVKSLRNLAHIQIAEDVSKTDYNIFDGKAHRKARQLLKIFLLNFYGLSDEEIQKKISFLSS